MTTDVESLLRDRFQLATFKPGQQAVIGNLLAGRSAAAVFPTGGGKSLCYQLARAAADGRDAGRLAADRADEGPDRSALAAAASPPRRLDSTLDRRRSPRKSMDEVARRPPAAAVRRAGAVQQRALPRGDAARARLAVRRRRGALHLRMGAQLPPRLSEAGRVRARNAGPSACWRSPPPPRRQVLDDICRGFAIDARVRRPHRLLSPEPDAADHAGRRRATATRCCSTASRDAARAGRRSSMSRCRRRPRTWRQRLAARRLHGPRLSRRAWTTRMRAARAGLVPGVGKRHRRGHDRLRHGDRQGEHPLRLSLQPAQEPGKLLAGDRPRRARRPAGDLRDCSSAPTI